MPYNRDKAYGDLEDMGEFDPEEVYDYGTDEGFREFVSERGLDPDKYGTGDDGFGGSDDGCFLTTACVVSKNLPDDCEELTTLRNFRDTYLKVTDEGKRDTEEYYNIAPKIVEKINEEDNSKAIWDTLYQDLVLATVNFIKEDKSIEAYELYKRTVMELKGEYL